MTIPADGMNSDIHGSAEYRAHLIGVMARRAVARRDVSRLSASCICQAYPAPGIPRMHDAFLAKDKPGR